MIEFFTYQSAKPGPRLLILGAVHGNEKCGTVAINRIRDELDSGKLALDNGTLTVVPICNPRAYELDVRQVERNLNRYLIPMAIPNCYEAELGNALCPLLTQCDVLLDIHSYTVGGAPFVVIDSKANEVERAFGHCLGAEVSLHGWLEAYAATGRGQSADPEEATGTTTYAQRHGAIAVTLECGQHKAPEAEVVAYRAIHNALRHLGMVPESRRMMQTPVPQAVTMTHVYYQDDAGLLAKPWRNFEAVGKGEVMAMRGNGETLLAPDHGVIIMPKAAATAGEEWFYFGVMAC